MSSSGSTPKTPVVDHVQEMSRIERVLTQVPVDSAASRHSGRHSSRPYATGPTSQTSPPPPPPPPEGTATGLLNAPSAHGSPTVPQTAERRTSQQAIEQIRHSVQRLQAGQLDEARIADPEAQRTQGDEEVLRGRKVWWWQKPRWKGVQNRLITAIIAGTMCTIVLAICVYSLVLRVEGWFQETDPTSIRPRPCSVPWHSTAARMARFDDSGRPGDDIVFLPQYGETVHGPRQSRDDQRPLRELLAGALDCRSGWFCQPPSAHTSQHAGPRGNPGPEGASARLWFVEMLVCVPLPSAPPSHG